MLAKVLVGVSAAGKSTYARELTREGYIALDRDDMRFSLRKVDNWSDYKFDRKVERLITNAHENICHGCARDGVNIVIAETNLLQEDRNRWKKFLTCLGYEVEFVPLHITLDEAIERNRLRDNGLPEEVIRDKQWPMWLEFLKTLED